MTIDDYRTQLMNEILLSSSEDEIRQSVDIAMTRLVNNKVHGHIVARFVDKTIGDLDRVIGSDKPGAEVSNSRTGKSILESVRRSMTEKIR